MTTYYLNDASLNWVLTANDVSSAPNTNLTIQTSGLANTLSIQALNGTSSSSLVLSADSIQLSTAFSTDVNKMNIEMFNDVIRFNSTVSGSTTEVLSLNASLQANFTNLPTCSAVPTSNSQMVNKLYVDDPIQQATFVRGGTNLICNMPKYIGADNATRHPSATQNIMGFLYPTKNITITTLVTHTSNTGTYSTGTSPQRMVLVSFPSLDSIVATVVARTADDPSLWTGSSSTYARALETPVSYTLLKGTKYAIVCLSGSSANFDIRGRTYNNADTFNFTSTYDLQIGGTYNSSSDLAIGATFNVSSTGASNVPYVSAL